jgi:YVTN family beta-propeller protein
MTRFALLLCLAGSAVSAERLLVLNKGEASLWIIDAATWKPAAKIAVGEGPHEMEVSGDGKLGFAANYGGGQAPGRSISVIDLAAGKEIRRVDTGILLRPHGLAFADGKLYFTAEANKAVGRYDPAADRVDWVMGTGQNSTHMVMASADGSRLYTANIGSDSITILERGNGPNWSATVVPVGRGPEGMDISPDGKQLWTAQSRDGGVSAIDLAAKKVVRTLDARTKRSNRLKFTKDGKRVLISDREGGELVVLDVESGKEVKRLKLGRMPEGILVLPDGKRALVAVSGDNYIAIVDTNSLEVTGRIETGAGPDGMAWVN